MPVTEALREPSPLAAVLGYVEDGVQDLKIGDAYITALARKVSLDPGVLGLSDFHTPNILRLLSVNKP